MQAYLAFASADHGRLVFRCIASSYVAHWAPLKTSLEDAIHVGSIRIGALENPDRHAAFVTLMCECVADAIERVEHVRPQWELENS